MFTATSSRASIGSVLKWNTSKILAPIPPISVSSCAKEPGLSLIRIRTVKYLPAEASPVCMILSNNKGSIFPPDNTIATGPSNAFGFAINAAAPAAPPGSTNNFPRSKVCKIAIDNSLSVTVITSST